MTCSKLTKFYFYCQCLEIFKRFCYRNTKKIIILNEKYKDYVGTNFITFQRIIKRWFVIEMPVSSLILFYCGGGGVKRLFIVKAYEHLEPSPSKSYEIVVKLW